MESLIDIDKQQSLPLALKEDVPIDTDGQGLPVFTGEQFYRNRPGDYELALRLASEGMTIRGIARVVGASKNTIQAILARERGSLTMDRYREAASMKLRHSLSQTIDRIDEALEDEERMAKASPRDLAYLMKELAEKMQLFSGGATYRGERGGKEDEEHAEDMEYLRKLQAIDAEAKVGPAAYGGPAGRKEEEEDERQES